MNAYAVRHGFRVPDGFEVSLYAGDDLVHDIFSMTTDGDGVADGEHSANGIVKGPDGWFYLICGNDAGISSEHAKLPGSCRLARTRRCASRVMR